MLKNKITVLFICPYPTGQSPSQRFRFEQYFDLLHANAFSFDVHPFLSLSTWQVLYQPGNSLRKISGVLSGFAKRLLLLPFLWHYDFIFIHREATPVGPPWFEWTVAKVLGKKIIYDFDDAIWLPNTSKENSLVSILKWNSKVSSICKWSYVISCGNEYLCDFAKQFNSRVYLNPTTIDTERLHNPLRYLKKSNEDIINIGWTGTHSTLKYLETIIPVIKSLETQFPSLIRFIVIADTKPSFKFSSFHFVPWSKETEIQDLLQFDIGLMPLTNDVWSKGKCGFKLLQYLALGIPAIASPVGVNASIIEQGVNGFLCDSLEQWENKIKTLIKSSELRKKMGESGRTKIINYYSLNSNSATFLSLFE
jgi:glycosyltransferase involved in cell wall biosynthesis